MPVHFVKEAQAQCANLVLLPFHSFTKFNEHAGRDATASSVQSKLGSCFTVNFFAPILVFCLSVFVTRASTSSLAWQAAFVQVVHKLLAAIE